jgi:pre-60S factor REI1
MNSSSRQLALRTTNNDPHPITTPRTAQGLAGLSDHQILALQMVDRKMKSREESAKARVWYAAQQQPVKAMYYKTENPVYQAG